MSEPPFYLQRADDRHQVVFDAEDQLLPELLREYAKAIERAGNEPERVGRVNNVLRYVTNWQRFKRGNVPTENKVVQSTTSLL